MGAIAERNIEAGDGRNDREWENERGKTVSVMRDGNNRTMRTYDEDETVVEEMVEEDKDGGGAISCCLALVALFGCLPYPALADIPPS